jgi:hypothetical protein
MTYHDLARKLSEKPFKPFRIRMVNNTICDVTEPWMVTLGESSAIVVTQTRRDDRGYDLALDWRTISISHILEFSDLDEKQSARKRKGA